MLNQHKIISAALGLLFMLVLVMFSNPVPVFRFILPAFFGVLLVTYLYNRKYLIAQDKYNFWVVVRPLLLETSGFFMYLVLPNSFFRGLFLLVTVVLIAVFEMMLANYSENILLNETLLIAFAFCFAFLGFAWWAPGFLFLHILGLFLCLLFLARCFYEFVPHSENVKWLNALVVSFLSAQIFWICTLLPFHYSALAVLLLDFYYLILVLNYHSLFHSLTFQRIKFNLVLAAASLILVFSATPWEIIN